MLLRGGWSVCYTSRLFCRVSMSYCALRAVRPPIQFSCSHKSLSALTAIITFYTAAQSTMNNNILSLIALHDDHSPFSTYLLELALSQGPGMDVSVDRDGSTLDVNVFMPFGLIIVVDLAYTLSYGVQCFAFSLSFSHSSVHPRSGLDKTPSTSLTCQPLHYRLSLPHITLS